jgi:RNA polymerase sigma factor (sigma-70 family)
MATSPMNGFIRRLTRGMAAQRLVEQSDRELLERLRSGPDEAAFEALVHRHGPMVYRVCWRVLRHAEDCEDSFQATFLLLAQKLRTVKKQDSLASWLHGVAHRVALNAKAKIARQRRHESRVAAAPKDPPDEITLREFLTVLDTELAGLPEKHRSPLILCYLEGRCQDEAARQLGWNKRTLLRRLEEARAALGRRLTRKGIVWPAAVSGLLLSDCVAPAALPATLVDCTVKAAACALVGPLAAGVVSAKVTALVEGVMKAMFLSKVKSVLPALVLVATLIAGALAVFGQGRAVEPPPQTRTARFPDLDKPDSKLKPIVVPENATVTKVAWSADGKAVATVIMGFDFFDFKTPDDKTARGLMSRCTVKIWEAATGKLIKSLGEEKQIQITALALSPDKKHMAIAGGLLGGKKGPPRHFVRILDAKTWTVKQDLDDVPGVYSLVFSKDGKTLAMGGTWALAETGSFVKLWDVQGEKMKGGTRFAAQLAEDGTMPDGQGWHVVFSPDGKVLAAAEIHAKRAKIQLYDGQTGKPKKALDLGESKGPFQVAFTADGKGLVSTCGGTVKVWDVRTGTEVRTLNTKGMQTRLLAVSPDGRYLATDGIRKEKDKVVFEAYLWDAKTGKPKQTLHLQDPSMWVSSLAFSPDGTSLAIGGVGGSMDPKKKDGDKTKGELKIVPLAR